MNDYPKLVSEQHPQSKRFRLQETNNEPTREIEQGGGAEHCGEVEVEKVAKENPLSQLAANKHTNRLSQ